MMPKSPTSAEIAQLIDARASENDTLEFKAEPWDGTDAGKKECLKDITALANTRGGLILIGINEEDNSAISVNPLTRENVEAVRSRINDLIHHGVEPRLYGVQLDTVEMDSGFVATISVPQSAIRPHRVTTGGSNRFWLRHSTGAMEATVFDLRDMFLQSTEALKFAKTLHRRRCNEFRSEKVFPNEVVVPNLATDECALVLHLIPADAVIGKAVVDPKAAQEIAGNFMPIGSGGSTGFTLEGFLFREISDGLCRGYTLVRRDGIVEAVKIGLARSEKLILPPFVVESRLVESVKRYVGGLISLGVSPPFHVLASLDEISGHSFIYESAGAPVRSEPLARQRLTLPTVQTETADSEEAVASSLRPMFDALWNAVGQAESPSFEMGEWVRRVP